jgi:sugar/nucleoside kinase (ribokinase family)
MMFHSLAAYEHINMTRNSAASCICSNSTFFFLQGTSSTLIYDSDLANLVSKTNLLIVEGYLFELPHTIEAIKQACEDAHKNGSLIALTASDVSCIKRCYNDFW